MRSPRRILHSVSAMAVVAALALLAGAPAFQGAASAQTLGGRDPDSRDQLARTVELLSTDPIEAPHAISDRLLALIDGTPAGEEIDVVTYFIDSSPIAGALRAAVERGVRVRVLLAGNGKSRSMKVGERLLGFLDAHDDGGSWGQRSTGAARATGGLTHQKTWRFSRSGDQRLVVVTGS